VCVRNLYSHLHLAVRRFDNTCAAGCQTQMFSATTGVNTAVGNVAAFSFSGWNYDVQVQTGSRPIYRLNDQATFKV